MSAILEAREAKAPDRDAVLAMINAAWMCQAIGVACALGIPDRLAAGGARAERLAADLGVSADGLARLLHGLGTLGLVDATEGGMFSLTPDGRLLTSQAEGSLYAWAIMNATRSWSAWTHLAEGVRTGCNVRSRTQLASYEEFGAEAADLFNRAMGVLTRPVAQALRQHLSLAGDERVVDVGGGAGQLVAPLLDRYPRLRAVVFDLEHARALAEETMGTLGFGDRWQYAAGSFFDAVPAEADVYLLKSVLHNWDDTHALAILRRCREAMKPGARLVILERIVATGVGRTAVDRENARSDLQMLLACDGRERTEDEFRRLLAGAGLRIASVMPLTPLISALEATAG